MSSGNVHGGSAAQLFGVARVDILLCGLDAVSEMIHRSMLPASIPQSSLTLLWSQTGYLPARRARHHNPLLEEVEGLATWPSKCTLRRCLQWGSGSRRRSCARFVKRRRWKVWKGIGSAREDC